jgi:hypothetical protein
METLKNKDVDLELEQAEKKLKEIKSSITNSGGPFMQLFLGKINSLYLTGDDDRKIQFKSEYEEFKLYYTLLNIPIILIILAIRPIRILDQGIAIF